MSDNLQTLLDRLPSLGDAVLVTLEMTLGGAVLAMVVALVLGFGARTRSLWVRVPSRVVIEALGLNYGAYAAEVVRGSIDSVPTAQWEAATALNLGWFHKVRRVVFP